MTLKATDSALRALLKGNLRPEDYQRTMDAVKLGWAELALAENVIATAERMRLAAIPLDVHGVARFAVERFDDALAALRLFVGDTTEPQT